MSAAMTVLKISGKVNPAKGGQNTKKKKKIHKKKMEEKNEARPGSWGQRKRK